MDHSQLQTGQHEQVTPKLGLVMAYQILLQALQKWLCSF